MSLSIIDRYILKNVLSWTLQSLMILLFIFVFGGLIKEFKTLLVDSDAGWWLLLKFFLIAIPMSLGVALPISFLVGSLVTYSQFSSNSELNSIRWSGLSLKRVVFPTLLLGIFFSLCSYFVNTTWVPWAKKYQYQILYEATKTRPAKLFQNMAATNNVSFDVDRIEGTTLHNINWTEYYPESDELIYRQAARGELTFIDDTQQISANLFDIFTETQRQNKTIERQWIDSFGPVTLNNPNDIKKISRGRLTNLEIKNALAQNLIPKNKQAKYYDEVDSRNAVSCACFTLIFLGIPLAIGNSRKDSFKGIIASIIICLIYFLYLQIAGSFGVNIGTTRSLLFWLPNALCLLTGAYLFHKKEALYSP